MFELTDVYVRTARVHNARRRAMTKGVAMKTLIRLAVGAALVAGVVPLLAGPASGHELSGATITCTQAVLYVPRLRPNRPSDRLARSARRRRVPSCRHNGVATRLRRLRNRDR
jgi:hypothetical protein